MSKLGDRDHRHDRFYRQARRQSFAARSVFKLDEIDGKHHLLSAGQRVLDLGCRPGSWLQYCGKKVGRSGRLVGVDRAPLDIQLADVRIVVGDVFALTPAVLLEGLSHFDVVLSDMAPDTTGVRQVDQARSEALFERALDLAEATLAPGGHFLAKLFQGPDFQRLVARVRARFGSARTIKPESSRKESIEQYVLGLGFNPVGPPARS
jgi:23S rRNA (uridine2552-2'-O)-methyltransferase